MSVIVELPERNLWEDICQEFAKQRPPFVTDDDKESVATEYENYNPAIHNPVFYGRMYSKIISDADVYANFDPSISHPSCVGYSFASKPAKVETPPVAIAPDRVLCTAKEYLSHYILPYLLPALEAMLKQAKTEKCFERRKTKFNACDFITEYLYKNNPFTRDDKRSDTEFLDIPFVKSWLQIHPRPPLPKSLVWTEGEAAIIIQSFWRGYLIRREAEVQELRIWQREWKNENHGIQNQVSEFWNKQMPHDGDDAGDLDNDDFAEETIPMAEVNDDNEQLGIEQV